MTANDARVSSTMFCVLTALCNTMLRTIIHTDQVVVDQVADLLTVDKEDAALILRALKYVVCIGLPACSYGHIRVWIHCLAWSCDYVLHLQCMLFIAFGPCIVVGTVAGSKRSFSTIRIWFVSVLVAKVLLVA